MAMLNIPSPMTSEDQIIPVGSPHYIQTETLILTPYDQARLKLWVWTGNINNASDKDPNYTLIKDKVSSRDNNVVFEISEFIKPFIKPQFTKAGSHIGETAWFYYEVEYIRVLGGVPKTIQTTESLLYLATLGWSWNYEDQAPVQGQALADGTYDIKFGIDNLTSRDLYTYVPNFTYSYTKVDNIGAEFNSEVVKRITYDPVEYNCAREPFVITFLNKTGFFEQLTTTGKVEVSNEISKDIYRVTRRNPRTFVNRQDHSQKMNNLSSVQTFRINTGRLEPILANKIEEIYSSPLVYITDVNTAITTAVIIDSQSLVRKTQINDKNKISYVLAFKETTNKIRSII